MNTLKQLIIKYLEAEGQASKSKIEDHLKELKGTTGDCCSRRLRELVQSGIVEKFQKEYADKTYWAYRVAKTEVPILGKVENEVVEFFQNKLI